MLIAVGVSLRNRPTAVDNDIRSGYITRSVRGKKSDSTGDLMRKSNTSEQGFIFQIGEEITGGLFGGIRKRSRGYGIHPDILCTEVGGCVFGEVNDAGFRHAVIQRIVLSAVAVYRQVGRDDPVHGPLLMIDPPPTASIYGNTSRMHRYAVVQ